jgi:hypothetical protein
MWAILLLFLGGCKTELPPPEATDMASPEAVALSLSTVDPEESLHLFEYDQETPLDIQEEARWQEYNAEWIDFTYESPMGGRVDARLVTMLLPWLIEVSIRAFNWINPSANALVAIILTTPPTLLADKRRLRTVELRTGQ